MGKKKTYVYKSGCPTNIEQEISYLEREGERDRSGLVRLGQVRLA